MTRPARIALTSVIPAMTWVLSACGRPVLSVDDAVMFGDTLRLVAFVEREPMLGFRSSVKDCDVRFYVDGREIGEDDTNADGRASVKYDGPTDAETFEARAVLAGRKLRAAGSIHRWDEDRTIVAVDIDDTIAETEYTELIFEDADDSDPVHDSQETLRHIANDYHIVYVTARPRFLLDKTLDWLKEKKYPAGPVITVRGLRQMLRPGKSKRAVLHELRKRWSNLSIGIGNNAGDAYAYGANKMLCLIIPSADEDDDDFGRHAVLLRDWDAVAEVFEQNRDIFSDPKKLSRAVRGKRMLTLPLRRWEEK